MNIKKLINAQKDKEKECAVQNIKNNFNYFWSYAKRTTNLPNSIEPLKNESGNYTNDPKKLAK